MPLVTDQEDGADTVTLRFYDDMPNVAYISATLFHDLVHPGNGAAFQKEEDGTYTLSNDFGQAVVDVDQDIFSSDDYYAYTDTAGPSATAKVGELLDEAPFARYAGTNADPSASAVTFDFSKYGIDLRGDDEGVYLPFATLSDLYIDSSFMYRASYNTEKVQVLGHHQDYMLMDMDEEWSDPILHMKERPADLAAFSYAELCFALEHFYGYPGSEEIDETIMKEQGLDAALKAYGKLGENAASLLQSTDVFEYFAGSDRLRLLLWDGDHTNIFFMNSTGVMMSEDSFEWTEKIDQINDRLNDGYDELFNEKLNKEKAKESVMYFAKNEQRNQSLGEGTYFTSGNTALCVFDSFSMNKEAWNAYYAQEEKDLDAFLETTQDDPLVVLLNALKKAQEDPNITNFVIDMSLNPGGNDGVAAVVESILTGEARSYQKDMISGQSYEGYFEVDRNFDGVFDEKDDEVSYDFNFAILTGDVSYSNASIIPAIMKDSGILIMGEKTRGGCCTLQDLATAEGIEFYMSTGRLHHIHENGEEFESGVVPDVDLYIYDENGDRIETVKEVNDIYGITTYHVPDYSGFYDLESIGKIMDEHYGTAEQAA